MFRTISFLVSIAALVLSVANMTGGATGWDFILWGWLAAFLIIALAAMVPSAKPLKERAEQGLVVAGGPLVVVALVWVACSRRADVAVLCITYVVAWGGWALLAAHREMGKNDPGFLSRLFRR